MVDAHSRLYRLYHNHLVYYCGIDNVRRTRAEVGAAAHGWSLLKHKVHRQCKYEILTTVRNIYLKLV